MLGRALIYVHDGSLPDPPALTGTTPPSPSRASTAPLVAGSATAEGGLRARLYAGDSCAGAPIGEADAASGAFSIPATAAPNATTLFTADVIDVAGNVSPCSAPLAYVHDDAAPAAPTFSGTTPASPSSATTQPILLGHAEPGATVTIYLDAACGAAAGASTGADPGDGAFVVLVTATPDATTTYWATATDAAGNVSACSEPIAFTHDSLPPPTPVLTGTAPASPSRTSTAPTISGTIAEAGLTIRVYKSADCTGSVAGTATGAGTSFGVGVTVALNSTTTFTAQATDGAGTPSGCSNAVTFTHDNLPPAPPVITGSNPASPNASSTTPQLLGTTGEAGVTVYLYTTASCLDASVASGPAPASGGGGGGAFAITASATPNASTTYYGRAVDAAGNPSACGNGFAYVHDSQGPPAPVLTAFSPTSPSTTATGVTVGGTEGDPTSRVYVYASASCGGAAVNPAGQIATASVFTVPFTPVDLGCTAVSAKAVDPSGNVSACSNSLTFTHYGCAQCACRAQDWLRTFGTSGDDTGAAAALGDNDNSYEVGATAGPLLGQSAYGGADAYIVKRSSSGVLIWARQLGTALYDAAQAVAVDPAGNVYVAGLTEGDIDGSGVPVATCSGGTSRCSDAWIARFQPDGTRDWLVRFGTDRRESIPDMAWDTKNSRLLVLVSSGATVGGNGLSPQVLAVTPVTGALATLWESVGDDQNKNPGGLHVDASGNIYVQGRAQFKMPGALSTTGSPIASPSSTPITPRSPCATCWRRPASRIT